MSSRLQYNEFVPHAPDTPGPTARVNHDSPSCSGTSRSMAVWMNQDGTIGAKCHRCGAGGFSKGSKPSGFKSVPKSKKVSYEIPDDIEYDWSKWSVKAAAYINKFGFTNAQTSKYGIGYSAEMDRLIFPATNQAMVAPGWQAKSFTTGTRYLTSTRFPKFMYTHIPRTNPVYQKHSYFMGAVLITEDLLSTIKGSEVLSSFAVLGTGISDEMVSELRSNYDTFYIWLDNDNATVKSQQLKMANKLSFYGKCFVIKSYQEPKELSPTEVADVLYATRGVVNET